MVGDLAEGQGGERRQRGEGSIDPSDTKDVHKVYRVVGYAMRGVEGMDEGRGKLRLGDKVDREFSSLYLAHHGPRDSSIPATSWSCGYRETWVRGYGG